MLGGRNGHKAKRLQPLDAATVVMGDSSLPTQVEVC